MPGHLAGVRVHEPKGRRPGPFGTTVLAAPCAERLGIGPGVCPARDPALVHARVTGRGRTSPPAGSPGLHSAGAPADRGFRRAEIDALLATGAVLQDARPLPART